MRAVLFGFTALLLAGPGFAQDQAPADAGAVIAPQNNGAAPTDGNSAAAPADSTANAAPSDPHAIDPSVPAMTGPQIVIATSMGNITLQLDADRAPMTTAHILRYIRSKHYDGTVFYRVVKGALIQMGSWDARGVGRPELPGKVPLETGNGLSNVRGTVGLARGDEPDSGGADFFINVGDESPLDAAKDMPPRTTGYAVFGKVIGGMDVVDAINNVTTGGDGPMPGQAPTMPILVTKVSIVPGTAPEPPPPAKPKAPAKPAAAAKAAPAKKKRRKPSNRLVRTIRPPGRTTRGR
jgi:cyclophilin family peptidyl-prolyl cis-trans isomerase